MLDDDTLEIYLGPGTMPGTETTMELPALDPVTQEVPHELPPHLANDPILTMPEPHATTPSLFEHAYHGKPVYYPARPMKAPRVPVKPKDHALAALAGAVILAGVCTAVLVHSGWNSSLPVSEQQRLHPSPTMSIPDESLPLDAAGDSPQSPVTSDTASPSHIPSHIARRPQVPLSAPSSAQTSPSADTAPPSASYRPPAPPVAVHSDTPTPPSTTTASPPVVVLPPVISRSPDQASDSPNT